MVFSGGNMKDYFFLFAFPHFSVHEEDQVIFKWYGINEKLVGVFITEASGDYQPEPQISIGITRKGTT